MFRTILAFAAITNSILACPDHTDITKLNKRADTGVKDWNYDDPSSWGSIKAEYATCSDGTTQSPINLESNNLSSVQSQTFSYASHVEGHLGNSGYGPTFTVTATDGITSKPSFTAGGKAYYLAGFHTHTTSEHTIDGDSSSMELHLVHTDSSGANSGVIGFPIEVGASSAFWDQILGNVAIPSSTDTATVVEVVDLDMSLLISEVKNLGKYWTYSGSLTTPPCTEGLRWWVSATKLTVSQTQLDELLAVSEFSSRGVQTIKAHNVGS